MMLSNLNLSSLPECNFEVRYVDSVLLNPCVEYQRLLRIRVRKDYEISITLNASFNQVEQLKAVSTYDGAEIFEGISEKGA